VVSQIWSLTLFLWVIGSERTTLCCIKGRALCLTCQSPLPTFARYAFIPTLIAWANLEPVLALTISLLSTLDKSYHTTLPPSLTSHFYDLHVLTWFNSHILTPDAVSFQSVLMCQFFFFHCWVSFHIFVLCNLLGYMWTHYHTSLCMHTVTASTNTLFGRFNARPANPPLPKSARWFDTMLGPQTTCYR